MGETLYRGPILSSRNCPDVVQTRGDQNLEKETDMARKAILDDDVLDSLLEERKRLGIDLYDEVWEGMYVMPSMPTTTHQKIVADFSDVFTIVVKHPGLGDHYPGANVSDRRRGWKENYRVPDIVVVLKNNKAIDCDTHFMGGPDFLIEIESPGDDTEDKVPFYSKIGVRELLIIQRDKRTARLLRHDGEDLLEVQPSSLDGKQWLVSEVLPLAFRRTTSKGVARTEVRRTDGQPGSWII
jgi:Uma2 family endonuclease